MFDKEVWEQREREASALFSYLSNLRSYRNVSI